MASISRIKIWKRKLTQLKVYSEYKPRAVLKSLTKPTTGFTPLEVHPRHKPSLTLKLPTGFTMLEAAVSIFIFTTIMGIGISSYINLLKANAFSQNIYSSIENISLGLERIWRDAKYGNCFELNENNSEIQFKDMSQNDIIVKLDSGIIKYIKNGIDSDLNDSSVAFVKNLKFYVSEKNTSITISVLAEARTKNLISPINLQASVAPINIPFPSQQCE